MDIPNRSVPSICVIMTEGHESLKKSNNPFGQIEAVEQLLYAMSTLQDFAAPDDELTHLTEQFAPSGVPLSNESLSAAVRVVKPRVPPEP